MARKVLLWVPKTTSFNTRTKSGYQSSGTKAFVPLGTRLHKGLTHSQKYDKLTKLAEKSHFFIKPNSLRVQKIRQKLRALGINVEDPIQDLGNGKALFKKTGNSLQSYLGINVFVQQTPKVVENICKMVAVIHNAGITHTHLHVGNIGVTRNGKIVLYDIGRAKFSKDLMKTNVGLDITTLTRSITSLYAHALESTSGRKPAQKEILVFENYFLGKLIYHTLVNSGEIKISWKTFAKRFGKHFSQYKAKVYHPELLPQ